MPVGSCPHEVTKTVRSRGDGWVIPLRSHENRAFEGGRSACVRLRERPRPLTGRRHGSANIKLHRATRVVVAEQVIARAVHCLGGTALQLLKLIMGLKDLCGEVNQRKLVPSSSYLLVSSATPMGRPLIYEPLNNDNWRAKFVIWGVDTNSNLDLVRRAWRPFRRPSRGLIHSLRLLAICAASRRTVSISARRHKGASKADSRSWL